MNTRFPYRVTICVPEAMIADANQLALCLGTAAADAETFADLRAEDAAGNRYAYAHTPVPAAWLAEVTAPLSAPVFAPEADMAAAERAQAALRQVTEETAAPAQPTEITAMVGPNILDQIPAHLNALGLVMVPFAPPSPTS